VISKKYTSLKEWTKLHNDKMFSEFVKRWGFEDHVVDGDIVPII